MTRSKHTTPPRIRAAARVRRPFESRSAGDPSFQRVAARAFKQLGIALELPSPQADQADAPLPRIRISRPRAGHHYPASRTEIAEVLGFFGEECIYGLRSVALVRGDGPPGFPFGTLRVPGHIQIFDLPNPPWALPGLIEVVGRRSLDRAGATIEVSEGGLQTVVWWSDASLKDFFLFDVLMHEVAHHMIQQYRGKRSARVMRTKDHEAAAERFARWCRRVYRELDAEEHRG